MGEGVRSSIDLSPFHPQPFTRSPPSTLHTTMLSYLLSRIIRWTTGLFLVLFLSYAMLYYGGG